MPTKSDSKQMYLIMATQSGLSFLVLFPSHFGYTSVTFQLYFSHISAIFRPHFGYTSVTFRLYSGYVSVTFRIHFGLRRTKSPRAFRQTRWKKKGGTAGPKKKAAAPRREARAEDDLPRRGLCVTDILVFGLWAASNILVFGNLRYLASGIFALAASRFRRASDILVFGGLEHFSFGGPRTF